MARNYFPSIDRLDFFDKIKPNYEVFYDDLIKLDIGSFFLSREFKILMIENNSYELWNKTLIDVENTRKTFSLITNQKKSDSEKVFIRFINNLEDLKIQNIITRIIEGFILNSIIPKNFELIKKDIEFLKFSIENITIIEKVVEEKYSNQIQHTSILETNNSTNTNMSKLKVFIVHGHDNHLKVEVARTLEKLKLQPIILHEQSNNGKTLIEKFEKFSDVSFAVILLTADDLGNSKNNIDNPNKRARQNVIFELGYFIGKLGRENVMTLKEEGVEVPNDISGVVYTSYDQQGHWKYELAKELKSAGFKIDMNDFF